MPGLRERVKQSNIWQEFVAFLSRGSIIELGVGIIIGGAFGKLVSSLVDDLISPPLGLLISGSNLENYFIVIKKGKTEGAVYETPEQAQGDGAVTENVGRFIMTAINFLMVAITLFLIVFTVNRVKSIRNRHRQKHHAGVPEDEDAKPEPAPASGATQTCAWCNANIPIKAVKCMYCTSFLHEKVPAELLNKTPQTALIELDG